MLGRLRCDGSGLETGKARIGRHDGEEGKAGAIAVRMTFGWKSEKGVSDISSTGVWFFVASRQECARNAIRCCLECVLMGCPQHAVGQLQYLDHHEIEEKQQRY